MKSVLRVGSLVMLLVVGAACRGTAADQPPPLAAPELVAIDIFGTSQITREQLLGAIEAPLRAFADSRMAGRDSGMAMDLEDDLHRLGDFAYAQPSLVGYYEPEGMKYYLTVDLVDREDAARRMPFLPAPHGAYEDPEGLLDQWRAFEKKSFELMDARRISPARSACPAFHCFGDHQHPELAPFSRAFVARVPAHVDELATILRDDADPAQRAAAAYLLAYAPDGDALVSQMIGAFRDPDPLVRNSVMRVVADVAFYHRQVDVPLEPVLDALEYPATLDRNKSAAIVGGLLERPGSARLHATIVSRSGATLLAMLQLEQPNNHNFAYDILRTISGLGWLDRKRP